MSEWHPIETFPGDGRWLLVALDDDVGPKACITHAHVEMQKYILSGEARFTPLNSRPIGWMPLPQPPKEGE